MAYVIINDKHLTAIADELRKLGGKPFYKPREMAPAIEELVGGGGYNGLLGLYFKGVDVPGAAFEVIVEDCVNDDGSLFIPENMWVGKTIVGDVTIPFGIVEIPDNLFKDTEGITDVEIPAGLTTIGAHAFDNAINGPDDIITLGPDVELIGEYSFANNTFKVFRMNDKLTSISNYAFSNSNFEELELNGDEISIGEYAFQNNTALKTIKMNNGTIGSIGKYAFQNNTALTDFDAVLTAVPQGVFSGCSSLKNITLSNDITHIKNEAFTGTALEEITIPDNVDTIGGEAFSNCRALTKVTFNDKLRVIGVSAFENCDYLSGAITIPEGVTTINERAFAGTTIEEVTIPGTVKVMGSNLFQSCGLLHSITLSEGLEKISDYAFASINTGRLMSNVYCPSTLKYIGNSAFADNPTLSVILNEGLLTIGNSAFANTPGAGTAKDGEIPSTVVSIGASAFENCVGIGVRPVVIPSGVTELKSRTYYGSQLTKITLNDGLKSIGSQCFGGTYLEELSCPASLESFSTSAFTGPSSGYPDYNYFCSLKNLEFNLSPDHQLVLDNTGSYYSLQMSDEATASDKNYITFKGQGGQIPKRKATYNAAIFGDSSVNNANTVISVPWSESENPTGFPWGATKATIIYNNGL